MFGSFLGITLLCALFMCRLDYIESKDVTNDTCTFIDDNLICYNTEGPIILENYHLVVKTHKDNSTLKIKGIFNYNNDQKLINKTIPCYFVHGVIEFKYLVI